MRKKNVETALQQSELRLQVAYSHLQIVNEELHAQSRELQEQNQELARLWELSERSKAALQESELRFRTMANSLSQLAWIARADGHILWYNQRWYDYTGTLPEQMEGWGWQSVHDANELPKVLERWQSSILTGESFDMTFPLRGADGVFRPFLTRVIPLKNADGLVLQWFGTNTDVSELKHGEQALRESEERHRVLAETMLQGVVHQDANGSVISMNPAAERILGKCCDDFKENGSVSVEHETIRANGEFFPGMEHPTMEALRTGMPVSGVIMGVFNPKLSECRWISIDAVPIFRPGENLPSEVYSVFEDITERKQSEQALQNAHDELEWRVRERTEDLAFTIERLQSEVDERKRAEKSLLFETAERLRVVEDLREKEQMLLQQSRQAAMGEMIGNIAHQWRQPLNTLGLFTQRLGAFYGLPGFNKEFLDDSIAKSMQIIKHMSRTIDDFRDYFKPEKEKSDFHVIEAIANTLSLMEGSFQNPKIGIDIVERGNPVINGYQNEFAQVFLNVLNNARDAVIEREVVDPLVIITICSKDDSAVVTVEDNAGGIPVEIINKVFDPYFTTKGSQFGTGIGLFMSKTIIEKNMGGRLTVRNSERGAEFRIEVKNGTRI